MCRLKLVVAGMLLVAACGGCYMGGLPDAPTRVAALPAAATSQPMNDAATPDVPAANAAVPSPAPSFDAAALEGAMIHTVQRGETLFHIAQLYKVPVDTLVAANAIAAPDRLLVGQTLLIPTNGQPVNAVSIPPTQALQMVAAQPTVIAVQPTYAIPPTLPVLLPPPSTLNGILLERIIVMPDAVRQNIANIHAVGQALGRNARAFSKLGDSIIENPHFLARFDGGTYNLGSYAYLQPAIDYYAGSFSRQGVAVRRGLHSWSVFDPMYATGGCQPGENMVACEFRLHNPSILFIRLGTNDVGVPESFDRNMRQLVEFCINSGVIPVLGTKADRFRDPADTNNSLLRQIAADYRVPLWDFDLAAQTIPNHGLASDGVHLTTFFAHDYTQYIALQRGHGVNNLTALMVLDAILRLTLQTNP